MAVVRENRSWGYSPSKGMDDTRAFLAAQLNSRGGQRVATPSHATAPLSLEQTERDLILQALEQTRGNRTRAAKLLGISRYTLLYRMKKYFGAEESGLLGEA